MVFFFQFISSPGISVQVSSILLGLVMVGRAAFVFPLSFLSNLTKKSPEEKIGFNKQVCVNNCCYAKPLKSYGLSFYPFADFADCNMVGWTYARCCFSGSGL